MTIKNPTDNATQKVREGMSYAEGVNFEVIQPNDVQKIPFPSYQPSFETLQVKEHESLDEVMFDIKITGLGNCNLILLFQNRQSYGTLSGCWAYQSI